MMQWLKQVLIVLLVAIIILFGTLLIKNQNKIQQNSTEVEAMLESSILGNTRLGKDGGVNKKEFVANLVESVIKTQKTDDSLTVKYAFLDDKLQKTTDETKIDSVQFIIETHKPDSSKVLTRAVRRMSLNFISKREEGVKELSEEFYFGIFDQADNEVTISIPNLGKITGIKFTNNNPNATATVKEISYSEGTVTLQLNGGTPFKSVVENGDKYYSYKYISSHPTPQYSDAEGYVGYLNKTVKGGQYIPAESTFITQYDKENYEDGLGFKGTLTKDENPYFGYYTPEQKRYITLQPQQDYVDLDGFEGTLEAYKVPVSFPDGTLFKDITNYNSSQYSDNEGFVGDLDEKLDGFDSKSIIKSINYSDKYDLEYLYSLDSIPYSDSEGRIGDLYRTGNPIFVPNGKTESNYKTVTSSVTENINSTKPTSKPTAQGEWEVVKVYSATKLTGLQSEADSYDLDDVVIADGKTSKEDFERAGGVIGSSATSLNAFLKSPEGEGIVATENTKQTPIYIVKWGWKRTIGDYVLTYGGTISKPKYTYAGKAYKLPDGVSLDDLDTDTFYRGFITKPAEDTRIYNYSGLVNRPEIDTREFTYSGQVRALLKQDTVSSDGYEYQFKVKYIRYEDLTTAEKEAIDTKIENGE